MNDFRGLRLFEGILRLAGFEWEHKVESVLYAILRIQIFCKMGLISKNLGPKCGLIYGGEKAAFEGRDIYAALQ